eukprot:5273436-Karenia_brevis.AAC.1
MSRYLAMAKSSVGKAFFWFTIGLCPVSTIIEAPATGTTPLHADIAASSAVPPMSCLLYTSPSPRDTERS